jgi:outer membrane protein OmpA-like peptidoglycan-associated protein
MNCRLLLAAPILAGLAACTSLPATTATDAPRAVVFFTGDSAALDENAQQVIRRAAEMARSDPSAHVRVLGFAAPDTGTPAFNHVLAQARAQNVADGLVAAGVAPEHVRIQSRGAVPFEQMPTESRRVEIAVGT